MIPANLGSPSLLAAGTFAVQPFLILLRLIINMATTQQIKLPELDAILQGMPERELCRCGEGLPEVSFDFNQRVWFVWCGCGQSSNDMGFLDHAILDFNTKNKR